VSRRRGLVKRRTQVKNEISAVLHRNLKGRCPASDPFGHKGRAWIAEQDLPVDEQITVNAGLRQLDFRGGELAQIDGVVAQQVLDDPDVHRLMTIPGIDVVTATTLVAVIGDIHWFSTARHLVGYLGLHPTIRPSGSGPARHGRLSKEGSAAARHARKLAVLAWHLLIRGEDYAFQSPSLVRRKLRALERQAGAPRAKSGPNADPVWTTTQEDAEKHIALQAEIAY